MADRPVRVGCSGWNYAGLARAALSGGAGPARRWLAHYATRFDTVEVNSTFYRLARPAAVARWVEETPDDFRFTVKASRYLTHVRRLQDTGRGIERLYAGIAPLAESPKLGPLLWQLPENFHRDDDRLAAALEALPAGPPRLRVPARELVLQRGVRAAAHARRGAGDRRRQAAPAARVAADRGLDADPLPLRHAAGAAATTASASCGSGRTGSRGLRKEAEVLAYFNNDWEGFAVRNGLRLKALLRA